jgi:hypothetical protein
VRLEAFMLADAADSYEGKLYIHGGGITRIQAPALPWLQPQLALVARFHTEPGEVPEGHTLEIRIIDPNGAVAAATGVLKMPAKSIEKISEDEETYVQVILTMGPLPFAREGTHYIEMLLDGDEIRSFPLPVKFVEGVSVAGAQLSE